PVCPVYLPDDKCGIITVNGKRVYHVNIVIRYGMEGRSDQYARYRVVLSRNGIKRITFFAVAQKACSKSAQES
ncbi:MAG: hypothetical protein PHS41_09600, partial [Victivallaceae bacterium]|nr:hypothetical protein [Victivallaceae bacterium]